MTITTRAGKGSALTHNELDANFTTLQGLSGTTTITRSGTKNAWSTTTRPFKSVAVSPARASANYIVDLEVTGADDMAAVGDVVVYDKATNAFKIRFTGSTNNVVVLWKLRELV